MLPLPVARTAVGDVVFIACRPGRARAISGPTWLVTATASTRTVTATAKVRHDVSPWTLRLYLRSAGRCMRRETKKATWWPPFASPLKAGRWG